MASTRSIAARALCERVDVYGAGLLALGGIGAEIVYTHAYDVQPARCVNTPDPHAHRDRDYEHGDSSGDPHPAPGAKGPKHRKPSRRYFSQSHWRRARMQTEVLLHVWHAFGLIRWVQ